MTNPTASTPSNPALDRAVRKAYWRLLPLLFLCYVIAYVDRVNVSIAKLTMQVDLPEFNNAVIGFGAGIFFVGYFLLEIPGTLLVEKWSARKWISRIMISWGIIAALTAFIHHQIPVVTPATQAMIHWLFWFFSLVLMPLTWLPLGGVSTWATENIASLRATVNPSVAQFYGVRFLLGLAEAGFFPGAIVYMTHWFPSRVRSRALSIFLIATPFAQVLSPKISNFILRIGTVETVDGAQISHPELMGMEGWQWVYIFWGIPAVLLGLIVLFWMTDHPHQAKWLDKEECKALEDVLAEEKRRTKAKHRMTFAEAMRHPKVLLLALAYFCIVSGNYGVDFFLPSILKDWYKLTNNQVTSWQLLPPIAALVGIMVAGWSSDRTGERRLHAVIPGILGAVALALAPSTQGNIVLTIACFAVVAAGVKAYLPAFWTLPSLFLTEAAAAGSIGLINSVGNLGGQFGPTIVGKVQADTGSFAGGIYALSVALFLYSIIIFFLGLGGRKRPEEAHAEQPAVTPPLMQGSLKPT